MLHGGPAQKLDGDVATWSPEHMLLSAVGLSMLTTFEAFAARDGLVIAACNAQVSGTVEHTPDGVMFTSIVMELALELTGNIEHLDATLEDARQCCLVINSLRVPVVVETVLRSADGRADELTAEPRPHHTPAAFHPQHAS